MLYLYIGTDREAIREALEKRIANSGKGRRVVRISDAHALSDLAATLEGPGMFDGPRVVILESILSNADMAPLLLESLQRIKESADHIYIREEKADAATKKRIEKYAEESVKLDAAKGPREGGAFDLGFALQRGDKKSLWVGYMREIAKGSAPEMIHGILFWAAKQALLKTGTRATPRARHLVAELAALPHEARRRGYELEYALEEFIVS